MRVRWTRRASRALIAIGDYIAQDRPIAADQVIERIRGSVENLSSHPYLGRPGRVPGTRELVIAGTPYIVPYRIREDEVVILTVFHGARKWPASF